MEVAAPPVPTRTISGINAPKSARDPNALVAPPVPVADPETTAKKLFGRIPHSIPWPLSEPLFAAAKLVNKVVFRSPPPGKPVPAQSGSWTFSVIGDYGSGIKPLTDVTNNIARSNPDLVLTVGDNVYWYGAEDEWRRKWDPPKMFGDIRANFPVAPTLGNHEIKLGTDPYFRRFPELNGARFYSFDRNGVHFVALDTNESLAPKSPQYRWLAKDLEASKSDWKVVFFHHPMYSGYPVDNGPLKGYLAPLLAKTGVDLVLAGHEHNYARTKPLNDIGTVEVITGGGGQSIYPFVYKPGEVVAYRDVDFGHVNVEVTGDKLIGRYVVRDGSVRDTFVIGNNSPGTPPASPAAAPAPDAAARA